MRLERLKERVADAEERCKDDLTAATSSGGSIDSSSSSKDEAPGRNASATTKWTKMRRDNGLSSTIQKCRRSIGTTMSPARHPG